MTAPTLVEAVRAESDRRYYATTLDHERRTLKHVGHRVGRRSKLSAENWPRMVAMRLRGDTYVQIAEALGMAPSTVHLAFAKRLAQEIAEAQATGRDMGAIRGLMGRRSRGQRVQRVQNEVKANG